MNTLHQAPEHEFEAEHGLPEALPTNERILWQGSPDWRVLARDALHLRALSGYFFVLLVWRGATVLHAHGSAIEVLKAIADLVPLALLALGMMGLMAWLISRTSVYTVTDKRIVMRIGVVLGITFNLPFSRIESADVRCRSNGSGDITLTLEASTRIAYANLWPHARPWRIRHPQPTLRALADVRSVATVVSNALTQSAISPPNLLSPAIGADHPAVPMSRPTGQPSISRPPSPMTA